MRELQINRAESQGGQKFRGLISAKQRDEPLAFISFGEISICNFEIQYTMYLTLSILASTAMDINFPAIYNA